MNCGNCGTENERQNTICASCGADLTAQSPKEILKNKKRLIILSVAIITVIVAIFITLFMVISPNIASAKMRNAFQSKSGGEVINIFVDHCGDYSVIYDDLTRCGKAVFNEFEECITNAKDELNEQPVDTDINHYLLESTGDIFLPQDYSAATTIAQYNGELYNIVQDFYLLYSSKISYNMGTTAYSEADYSTAVRELSSVIESDSWYQDAQGKLTECQEKLLEEKLALIEDYINSGDYDSALQQVNSLRNENLTDEMKAKLDEYETKIYKAQLSKIDEYVNNGDFEGAKEYVESLGANLSDGAQARLDQALNTKASEYLTKADEALKSGERKGAYDMAVMAQTLCPDNAEIQKKIDYFKEYLPFELYFKNNAISYKENDDYWGGMDWNIKVNSNNNKSMENCLGFFYHSDYSGQYEINYSLAKKYNKVTGTVFVPESRKNQLQTANFKVYGDGKLLYTSKNLSKNVMPNHFSIDVSGVDVLSVQFYGTRKENYILGDAWTGFAISNLVATKNLPE